MKDLLAADPRDFDVISGAPSFSECFDSVSHKYFQYSRVISQWPMVAVLLCLEMQRQIKHKHFHSFIFSLLHAKYTCFCVVLYTHDCVMIFTDWETTKTYLFWEASPRSSNIERSATTVWWWQHKTYCSPCMLILTTVRGKCLQLNKESKCNWFVLIHWWSILSSDSFEFTWSAILICKDFKNCDLINFQK